MTHQEILQQADAILQERRRKSAHELRERELRALERKEYADVASALRRAQNDYAKALAFALKNCDKIGAEVEKLQRNYDATVQKLGLDLTLHPTCDQCKDSGYLADGTQCECRRAIVRDLLRKSCVIADMPPFTFNDHSPKGLPQKQAQWLDQLYAFAKRYGAQFSDAKTKCVLLYGTPGTGKSALLSAVGNDLLDRGYSVCYLPAYRFHETVLSRHLSPKLPPSDVYKAMFESDILLLDDLGTEPLYRNVTLESLLYLLDHRLAQGKPTWITTNLQPDALFGRYGERIVSRLTDKRYARVWEMQGENIRKYKR